MSCTSRSGDDEQRGVADLCLPPLRRSTCTASVCQHLRTQRQGGFLRFLSAERAALRASVDDVLHAEHLPPFCVYYVNTKLFVSLFFAFQIQTLASAIEILSWFITALSMQGHGPQSWSMKHDHNLVQSFRTSHWLVGCDSKNAVLVLFYFSGYYYGNCHICPISRLRRKSRGWSRQSKKTHMSFWWHIWALM